MESENRLYTVISIAGGFFCLAIALLFQSAPAVGISAIFFFLSIALWKYGYVIVPAIMKSANIVEVSSNFEIPPSQDVIVGKMGGNFLASTFLSAKLFESASEKDAAQKGAYCEMFEKAVSSAGFPFKVCALISPLELKAELEEMRTKRSVAETKKEKIAKSSRNESEIARLEREIAMWNRQIERLTSGERPLEVIFYLSTTASGLTKEEAISRARTQADELSVVVGSALSCEVSQLKGEEMKRCFWWEFFGPADSDNLHDQMF